MVVCVFGWFYLYLILAHDEVAFVALAPREMHCAHGTIPITDVL